MADVTFNATLGAQAADSPALEPTLLGAFVVLALPLVLHALCSVCRTLWGAVLCATPLGQLWGKAREAVLASYADQLVLNAVDWVWWKVGAPIVRRTLHVPKHMYFVMDGNRRWAKQRGQPTRMGHLWGYFCLQRLLKLLADLGVEEVTVYAFSIPNFKRTAEEKNFLMDLAKSKFEEMLERDDVVQEYNVRVRVVGDRARLPPSVLEKADQVEKHTAKNTTCTLNIAFAYAAQQELVAFARGRGAEDMWVPEAPKDADPPLFVRTSGEQRFSDFLTWQSGFAHLSFWKVLWPDFRAWHVYGSLLDYNRHYRTLCRNKES